MRPIVVLLAWALLGACGEIPAPAPEAPARVAEGLCAPHGVQAALCTQCNPALIPIFRAKNNYCEEHNFPESICPLCHPEKKGQLIPLDAPAPAAELVPPADGTEVRLRSAQTAARIGLEVVAAVEHPQGALLTTTARLVYDPAKYAEVNARAPGVVRELTAAVGAQVKAEDGLAVIQSAEVGAGRSRLKGARAALTIAQEELSRVQAGVTLGVTPPKDLLLARAAREAAQAEYDASLAALGEIDQSARGLGGYTLRAPIDGQVIRCAASLGQSVDQEEILFAVADTSTLWAEIDIPEDQLALVQVGQSVSLLADAAPDAPVLAVIDYLAPEVDPHTRTVTARALVQNPGGRLRANMFAQAMLLDPARRAVLIPRAAVQRVGSTTLVFVRRAADLYEARHVSLLPGADAGDTVGVLRGLSLGDQVVTAGAFLLLTETRKDSIGAGCCAEE